jgi:hypothetical protein
VFLAVCLFGSTATRRVHWCSICLLFFSSTKPRFNSSLAFCHFSTSKAIRKSRMSLWLSLCVTRGRIGDVVSDMCSKHVSRYGVDQAGSTSQSKMLVKRASPLSVLGSSRLRNIHGISHAELCCGSIWQHLVCFSFHFHFHSNSPCFCLSYAVSRLHAFATLTFLSSHH